MRYFFIITALLVGLNLTKVTVSVLIDSLGLIGVLFNLPKTYLGLTVLAVGNALPDAFTTMALVQSGSATLAISGGYAGQLFGLLIGFGISMLKLTWAEGPQKFDLFDPAQMETNFLDILVISACGCVLLWTFGYGLFNRFNMNKGFAIGSLVIYAMFFVWATYDAVGDAMKTF